MPEEEGEYEADTNAHDPGCQHKHQQSQVGQGLKYNCDIIDDDDDDDPSGDNLDNCSKLWHGSQLTCKHFHPLCLFLQPLILVFGSWLKFKINLIFVNDCDSFAHLLLHCAEMPKHPD